MHVHSDIWRRIWRAHDKREHPIRVNKVKAHATEVDVARGYPTLWKEANAYADAGAKQGRSMHPRDVTLERKACKAYVLLQLVARFIARISTESMLAADDVPPRR